MYKAEYNEIIRCLRVLSREQAQILDRLKKIEIKNRIPDKLMSMKDIRIYSGLSQSTIIRAIEAGLLTPLRSEGKKLFTQNCVNDWITNRSGKCKKPAE